ncbi:MAG: 4-hydroxy-3-methylbut-2-enyl diphosphate reductase [Prevotella sp.]|nr:4-hydroxy-3-methylbut-2-enyl diphosphate reductase [Prevotella sp.]
MNVEIDENSGFCFGVTTAIRRAEEKLAEGGRLYCLGDIVHNGMEVSRLAAQGLQTIGHEELQKLYGATVLLRAHGEPPETYVIARNHNIEIIDATCPVVLALQRRIYSQCRRCPDAQIVIFGKKGHAEVLGLVGQTNQNAIVIESLDDLNRLDFTRDIYLYSQTTKSVAEYRQIIDFCKENIVPGAVFKSFDTICRQVANRISAVKDFAATHDIIIFVCGRKSSNGKALFDQCLSVNRNSHLVESPSEILREWLSGAQTIGICGATSTPKWLMEACKKQIESFSKEK